MLVRVDGTNHKFRTKLKQLIVIPSPIPIFVFVLALVLVSKVFIINASYVDTMADDFFVVLVMVAVVVLIITVGVVAVEMLLCG